MMKICICGGGNLGHVTASFFAAQDDLQVSLLTTKPERWSQYLEIVDVIGKTFKGKLKRISSNPKDVIPGVHIVLVCLPGFAIYDEICSIAPYLDNKTWVGTVVSSTGFFFEAMKVLPKNQPLFGFQRVPFISRIINYGHVAELKGYKESLSVAVEQTNNKEEIRATLEKLFMTPTKLLDSYYEVSLSNSNPLLHTSRLYTMWKDWKPGMSYDRNPEFYCDWTVEAAELLIAMDEEFQVLLRKIGLKAGAIPPVLQYYESTDAESLTRKLHSIPAFKGILSPMVVNQFGKYEPDFTSRYFTEDFPYGMRYIVETAKKCDVEIPIIDTVYYWGIEKIGFQL
ncbi:MAG: NAD/NADP octopine/nopaline dehydrogenase family protein [Erysipelotrichaceae bacterium]|nr:NAD/NADP octopine/nopaline dehydrogenase family protein [Erysipelotrichaceae bacterium]